MRTRSLRAAFVVTLAVNASVACSRNNGPPPGNPPPPPMNPPVPERNLPIGNPPAPMAVDAPATCPAATPLDGTPCTQMGQRCTYESCGVADGATATCGPTGWHVERVTCNPPPPPGR